MADQDLLYVLQTFLHLASVLILLIQMLYFGAISNKIDTNYKKYLLNLKMENLNLRLFADRGQIYIKDN